MSDDDNNPDPRLPTSSEVVSALREAGWLLEQDTAMALEAAGFHTVTGKAFPDPDDPGKSREVDVHGYHRLFASNDLTLSVAAQILVECKQSTMPYVVVGGPAKSHDMGRERLEQHFRFPRVEVEREELVDGKTRLHSVTAREYLGLDSIPGNPWESSFLATQMTRLDRKRTWLADNRGIFDSLVYPLAKAIIYYRSRANRSSYAHHRIGQEWATTTFYYPIIVTSAVLYAVDISADRLTAVAVPWATMTRQIKASKIDGQFTIDVVTYESLPRYLDERVNRFCNEVAALAASDPQRFINHQDYGFKRRQAQPPSRGAASQPAE